MFLSIFYAKINLDSPEYKLKIGALKRLTQIYNPNFIMLDIHSLSFGSLLVGIVVLISLTMLMKLAKLETNFNSREIARKKLLLKPNQVKIFD